MAAQRTAGMWRVSLEGETIVLEFGQLRPPAIDGSRGVQGTDRIELPAEAARRLIPWLEDALRPHAAALQAARAQALPPAAAAIAARPGQDPGLPAPDLSGERAARLMEAVAALDVPHQYERSVRLGRAGLQSNRFLLTLDRRDVPGDAAARILAICDRLSMPQAARAAAAARLATAKCVHFGFEADGHGVLYKLYLERDIPGEVAREARRRGEGVLLHEAWKWPHGGGACVATRYVWQVGLTEAEVLARLSRLHGGADHPLHKAAAGMLGLATAKVPAEELQFLEVEEEGNPRRSYDLNLYRAGLQVKDVQHLLHRAREHLGIRPGTFQALYDQIRGKSLGHVAAGLHRDGADFLTLYYGVVGLPHFHERFR